MPSPRSKSEVPYNRLEWFQWVVSRFFGTRGQFDSRLIPVITVFSHDSSETVGIKYDHRDNRQIAKPDFRQDRYVEKNSHAPTRCAIPQNGSTLMGRSGAGLATANRWSGPSL